MSDSEEIYGRVARVLVEALNVDEGEITPAATLQKDLGAKSIDMLDIVFRVPDLFTVDLITRYISWKLGHGVQVNKDLLAFLKG